MSLKTAVKKNRMLVAAYRKCRAAKYNLATRISPKLNTAMRYKKAFGRKWDPQNPKTLNDKVLWLKFNTYWNNPLVRQCADKYRVREYVERIGCKELLNELIAVYERVEDIRFDELPDSFALKLNVGCGYNLIVPDKSKLDVEQAKRQIKKWMKEKYHLAFSEMQYKGVKPYILVEKYLSSEKGGLPEDYKFYCFNGEASYVMVCTDRQEGGKQARFWYYNSDWEMQMLTSDALRYGKEATIEKPKGIDEAFEYARKLSKGFPFVRVDFYIVDGKVIFGEMTFTPSGGFDNERLKETDELLGSFVKLG